MIFIYTFASSFLFSLLHVLDGKLHEGMGIICLFVIILINAQEESGHVGGSLRKSVE